ncbi:MAG: hypothetical protein B6D55_03035 [Candidatus Omnitrophica bacterium 4484_70.2]|nr:MAG: hypothetical protein B6D55_03035 [Candidatus Omnitrophica bacterium 4484_70.2]
MEIALRQWYKVLTPRPVVLISTIDIKGVSNAAPFSFVMPCSINPPLIGFASSPEHHTVKNILEVKDFVVNLPGEDIVEKLWVCAKNFPPEVNEIERANLHEEGSVKVKSPRIKECFAHFECKLWAKHNAGDHLFIIGHLLYAEVRDDCFCKGKYAVTQAHPLMHIGGNEFSSVGRILRVKEE